jgi:hypothetical protein
MTATACFALDDRISPELALVLPAPERLDAIAALPLPLSWELERRTSVIPIRALAADRERVTFATVARYTLHQVVITGVWNLGFALLVAVATAVLSIL